MKARITKDVLDRSINTLLGIIHGISIDGLINNTEAVFLDNWLAEHTYLIDKHPFTELFPLISDAVNKQALDEELKLDIVWLCEKLTSKEFYSEITAGIQKLHAIIGAIASDDLITHDELMGLRRWLEEHDYLKTVWPYDEIDSLVTNVLSDQVVTASEAELLNRYFSDFTSLLDDNTITNPPVLSGTTLAGLCATCPNIEFKGKVFTFTGESAKFSRSELAEIIIGLGGEFNPNVTKKTNFLVVGASGSTEWAYSCYGRKVEKAVELRKMGLPIVIVHENDLHDAIADI